MGLDQTSGQKQGDQHDRRVEIDVAIAGPQMNERGRHGAQNAERDQEVEPGRAETQGSDRHAADVPTAVDEGRQGQETAGDSQPPGEVRAEARCHIDHDRCDHRPHAEGDRHGEPERELADLTVEPVHRILGVGALDQAIAGLTDDGSKMSEVAALGFPSDQGRGGEIMDPGEEDARGFAKPTLQTARAPAAEEAVDGEQLLTRFRAQGRARTVGSGVPTPIRRPW